MAFRPATVLRWHATVLSIALLLGVSVASENTERMTIANMTCRFFEQPLNHFVPRKTGPTYKQRYCFYNGFVDPVAREEHETFPIFLYTGNESPLEQYINHTGLMWELAPRHKAQVIFMEHRYEGQSLPLNLSEKCMSYSSSIQALADFVTLLNHVNPNSRNPVIAFGGSYGGMLSSWLKMKYPNMVAGAIAASAPIWGLPNTKPPDSIDAAARVVSKGISMPYPPTEPSNKPNYCGSNMLAAWPIIMYLGKSVVGRKFLKRAFRLCHSLKTTDDINQLLAWAQSPLFDMAEGSFPYPSSYIPFSLHMGKNILPAWPVQAACWTKSSLHQDMGITFDYRNKSDVKYSISYGKSGITLEIDWDKVSSPHESLTTRAMEAMAVRGLLTNVREAVGVWYNITHDLQCFNVTPADNKETQPIELALGRRALSRVTSHSNDAAICVDKMKAEGSWPSLCCNEDINMPITLARGMGRDFCWPPDFPRGTTTYADIVRVQGQYSCSDPNRLFGYPNEADPRGEWLNLYYGGLRIGSHSNIVFSNGLLDPWSAGGVYAPGMDPTGREYDGPMVQNLTADGSMIALIIEFGGHHTDLMYSDPKDPQCVTEARRIENDYIIRWIREWNEWNENNGARANT